MNATLQVIVFVSRTLPVPTEHVTRTHRTCYPYLQNVLPVPTEHVTRTYTACYPYPQNIPPVHTEHVTRTYRTCYPYLQNMLPVPTEHNHYVGIENKGYATGHTKLHTTIGHILVRGANSHQIECCRRYMTPCSLVEMGR